MTLSMHVILRQIFIRQRRFPTSTPGTRRRAGLEKAKAAPLLQTLRDDGPCGRAGKLVERVDGRFFGG
jgi:hypothetical protein